MMFGRRWRRTLVSLSPNFGDSMGLVDADTTKSIIWETGKSFAFVFWNSFRGEKWPARSFFDQREETSSCTAETVANNIKGWIGEEENGDVLGNLVVWLAALFYFILFLCRRCWKYIRREARRCLFSSQVCQQPKWRRLKGWRERERERKRGKQETTINIRIKSPNNRRRQLLLAKWNQFRAPLCLSTRQDRQ